MPAHYLPVQKHRFFAGSNKRYDQVTWTSFPDVIQAFEDRIDGWYIKPITALQASSTESGFAVAGLTCLLIDALSQYVPLPPKPKNSLPGYPFKEFIRGYLRHFSGPLPVSITHFRNATQTYALVTLEDVIYHALRCGILHDAHATLYCGISGLNGKRFRYNKAKYTKYASDRRKCLTVIIDPGLLFSDTTAAFRRVLSDLRSPNPSNPQIETHFKKRFTEAFGVPV
jgi:hypothetical protein